jgi:hypothetical protein
MPKVTAREYPWFRRFAAVSRIKAKRGTMATQPKSNPDLVQVFASEQESEAMVVQSLLESAGIETMISGLDAPQDVLPGVGAVIVRVPADRAEEALQIIDDYRAAGPDAAEEGEISSEQAPETNE